MPSPDRIPKGSSDILKLQLELQQDILRSQKRDVELQEQLIKALLQNDSSLEPTGRGFEEAEPLEAPATGTGEQQQQPTDAEDLQKFLDEYDIKQEFIPWAMAPSFASFLDILKISMFSHPGDLAVCFPDRSAFFEAAEAAMTPGRFRDFLVTSLELRLLFQSLLLSITVPASFEQGPPENYLDLVISIFTFLLGVLNTIGVCLCIFACGIISSVSEGNFSAWLHANHRFVHAALSSQCAMVPMVLFLQVASQIRIQLSADWVGANVQMGLCGGQIAMIMLMMTAMLFATNAAGRTAAFSGAMGDAPVPAKKSIFSSTRGGNKVGLFGIKKYLAAVNEDAAPQGGKKKSSLDKSPPKNIDI